MEVNIVVAKYGEDIGWLNPIIQANQLGVTVYDKQFDPSLKWNESKVVSSTPKYTHVALGAHPFGNEEHTFLYHIIKNYPNFSEWEAFIQARPFDHCHDVINRIANLKDLEGYENGYIELSHAPVITMRFHGTVQPGDNDQTEEGLNGEGKPWKASKSLLLEYFVNSLPEVCWMRAYGMYAVKRENILRHPKESYQRLWDDRFDPSSPKKDLGVKWFLEYGKHIIFDDRYYK